MHCEEQIKSLGLDPTTDDGPGISRWKWGRGFLYKSSTGDHIKDPSVKKRIQSIGIPPAWNKVWIAPFHNCYMQATGYDSADRKQYRYHPKWVEYRNAQKFENILQFASRLAELREKVQADLDRETMEKKSLCSCCISLGTDLYASRV